MSLALTTAALGLAAMPIGAEAQDFGADEPALDEYVESLPIAEGNRPAGHKGRATPLPGSTRSVLAETPEGRVLERVASSPAAGAPSSEERSERRERRERRAKPAPADRPVRPAEIGDASLASAVADTAGANLLMLALLAAVPVALLALRRKGAGR
jgi:hypothetical protein